MAVASRVVTSAEAGSGAEPADIRGDALCRTLRRNDRMLVSWTVVTLLALATVACKKSEAPAEPPAAAVREPAQQTFASPEEAGTAVFNAARIWRRVGAALDIRS